MDFAKYFISARYLFGFLLPGALLLIAMSLVCNGRGSGAQRLISHFKKAKLQDWIGVLAVSLLIGHATTPFTMAWAVRWSGWIHRHTLASAIGGETRLMYAGYQGDLAVVREQARAVAQRRNGSPPHISQSDPEGDEHLFDLCKRTVSAKDKTMADRLAEFESEINLRAGPPIPLLVLALALLWSWNKPHVATSSQHDGGPPSLRPRVGRLVGRTHDLWQRVGLGRYGWRKWLVVLCVCALAFLLARGILPTMVDEQRSAYEMYLLVDREFDAPLKKAVPP